MRLFIPTIGTRLRLTEAWNFALHPERRNKSIYEKMHDRKMDQKRDWCVDTNGCYQVRLGNPTLVTIPVDTILSVDRIYIRSGKRGFDSITFRIAKGDCPDARFTKTRFWVKLEDCNNMVCEIERPVGFAGQDDNYKNVPPMQYGG